MKSTNWKDNAELIGIAAIVASLIFVGLQMKQSHEIALAAQYQARAETVMDLHQTYIEVGRVPRVPALRNGLSETMTAADINEELWLWIAMDNHYFQYQSDSWTRTSGRGSSEVSRGDMLTAIYGLYGTGARTDSGPNL